MSAVVFDGIKYAAGLEWLPRGNAAQTAREAQRGGSAWFVHSENQTGYAGGAEGHEAGMVSLAAVLKESIPEDLWLALVESEDGRFVLVRAKDGAILADGDQVFESIDGVRRAIEFMEETDWAFYATPGLMTDAAVLDAGLLRGKAEEAVRSGVVLRAAPLARIDRSKVIKVAAAFGMIVATVGLWGFRDEIVLMLVGPGPKIQKVEKKKEQKIATVIDPVALVTGCREGMRRYTPGMPGWKTVRIACTAKFSKKALIEVLPELAGRPVLTMRWKMRAGGEATLLRQVAERHLAEWKTAGLAGEVAGSVVGREAWAAVRLPPVTVEYSTERRPDALALRAAVDRRLGLRAASIEHVRKKNAIRVVMREPLVRIVSLIEGIDGFEVTRVSRSSAAWVIEGRRAKPVSMRKSRFAELRKTLK